MLIAQVVFNYHQVFQYNRMKIKQAINLCHIKEIAIAATLFQFKRPYPYNSAHTVIR